MSRNHLINEAKSFLLTKTVYPALESKDLPKNIKDKVQRTKLWIETARNIGNIYDYIKRYSGEEDEMFREVYQTLKEHNITPIEEIIQPFEEKFQSYLNEKFNYHNFSLGDIYTAWDLAHTSTTYNIQRGIYLVRDEEGNNQAILTKVTLGDGKYPNELLDGGRKLKHYLYSHNNKFDENYKVNQAVIESRNEDIPILVFINNNSELSYIGEFQFESLERDEETKWFILTEKEEQKVNLSLHYKDFELEVIRSSQLDKSERVKKINEYSKIPKKKVAITSVYERNPHVVAETLERANGHCEHCQNPAPFTRAKDHTPYLEVHHKIPLAEGGSDTVDNTLGLCPNCHRMFHFGLMGA